MTMGNMWLKQRSGNIESRNNFHYFYGNTAAGRYLNIHRFLVPHPYKKLADNALGNDPRLKVVFEQFKQNSEEETNIWDNFYLHW